MSTFTFGNDTLEIEPTQLTINGQAIQYGAIAAINDHYDDGFLQVAILYFTNSIFQLIITLNDGSTVPLERKGHSFYGIGTKGTVTRQYRKVTAELQNTLGPVLVPKLVDQIRQGTPMHMGNLTITAQGIEAHKEHLLNVEKALPGSQYGSANFNINRQVRIFDRDGRQFTGWRTGGGSTSNQNVMFMPQILDLLYHGR